MEVRDGVSVGGFVGVGIGVAVDVDVELGIIVSVGRTVVSILVICIFCKVGVDFPSCARFACKRARELIQKQENSNRIPPSNINMIIVKTILEISFIIDIPSNNTFAKIRMSV